MHHLTGQVARREKEKKKREKKKDNKKKKKDKEKEKGQKPDKGQDEGKAKDNEVKAEATSANLLWWGSVDPSHSMLVGLWSGQKNGGTQPKSAPPPHLGPRGSRRPARAVFGEGVPHRCAV